MSRTLDSQQSPLRFRAELFKIDLIKLTTYTDRANDTVDQVFYFSRDPVLFDYGNTGTDIEFWPVLQSVGPLDVSINHLPSQNDSSLLRKTLSFTLNNIDWQGSRLIDVLRNSHVLENARIEWTQLLLADRPTTARIDLTALAGNEHTFWYRGRVTRVGPITNDSISFACDTDIPNPIVLKALDQTKNDPKDFGKRLPQVYGQAKRVRAIGYDVGWLTTLAETITDATTGNTEFTDLSGISGSGNTIRIANEDVTVTWVSDTVGNITARAQNSTTAVAHQQGETAQEMIATISYVVAGHAVSAIQEVYVRNPSDGELIRIETGFTKTIANTSLISGESVATVSFTEAQLRTVMDNLFADVTVGGGANEVMLVDIGPREAFIPGGLFPDHQVWTNIGGVPLGVGGGGAGDRVVLKLTMQAGLTNAAREVERWRLRLTGNLKQDHTGGSGALTLNLIELTLDGSPGIASISRQPIGEEFGSVAIGSWATPTGGTTVSDAEGEAFYVYLDSAVPNIVQVAELGEALSVQLEIELKPQGTATLAGNIVGFRIELFADVDGYKAPSASPAYKAGSGNLIEKPCDVMRHMIEEVGAAAPLPSGHTLLTQGVEAPVGGDTETASIAPSANKTIIAFVQQTDNSSTPHDEPSISGNGLTWTVVESYNFETGPSANRARCTMWRASSASTPTPGPITFTFPTATAIADWSIHEFDGVDITTTDGVVNSKRHPDIDEDDAFKVLTMDAFASSGNDTFVIACRDGLPAPPTIHTVESGFTRVSAQLTDSTPYHAAAFRNGEDITCRWDGINNGGDWGMIGIELNIPGGVQTADLVDSDTYDDCNTNLGTDVLAFDALTLGLTWEEKLARVAFESRTNLVFEEFLGGTSWKMLTALSTYAFAAASGSVSEWDHGGFAEADQDIRFVHASRFTFPYAPDWSKGPTESAFTQLVVANEDTNDLTTPNDAAFTQAAQDIGSFEAEPITFKTIQQLATAEEIAGYYAHERIRIPVALFAISGIPWWEGYDLEVGDIINVTPPWTSGAVKSRIIEYTKNNETEQIELRLVEVQ